MVRSDFRLKSEVIKMVNTLWYLLQNFDPVTICCERFLKSGPLSITSVYSVKLGSVTLLLVTASVTTSG